MSVNFVENCDHNFGGKLALMVTSSFVVGDAAVSVALFAYASFLLNVKPLNDVDSD